jgi:hypothetical protein
MPRPKDTTEPTVRERIASIEADVRWLKWLVVGTFVGIAGQYVGIHGAVAEAVSRHLP